MDFCQSVEILSQFDVENLNAWITQITYLQKNKIK